MAYSVDKALQLGESYQQSGNYMAAEVCFRLTLIKDHIRNLNIPQEVEQKLHYLLLKIKQPTLQIPEETNIPSEAKTLIVSFYKPWLEQIVKPHLKVK